MRIGRVGGNHGNTMPVPRHRIGEAAREGTDPGGLGAIKIAEQQEAHQRWLYPIRLLETRFTTRAAAEASADLVVIVQGASCTGNRSEEHTSELQSLMRISYAVFCLKKKTKSQITIITNYHQT